MAKGVSTTVVIILIAALAGAVVMIFFAFGTGEKVKPVANITEVVLSSVEAGCCRTICGTLLPPGTSGQTPTPTPGKPQPCGYTYISSKANCCGFPKNGKACKSALDCPTGYKCGDGTCKSDKAEQYVKCEDLAIKCQTGSCTLADLTLVGENECK